MSLLVAVQLEHLDRISKGERGDRERKRKYISKKVGIAMLTSVGCSNLLSKRSATNPEIFIIGLLRCVLAMTFVDSSGRSETSCQSRRRPSEKSSSEGCPPERFSKR